MGDLAKETNGKKEKKKPKNLKTKKKQKSWENFYQNGIFFL
jgi:hypothetical protein